MHTKTPSTRADPPSPEPVCVTVLTDQQAILAFIDTQMAIPVLPALLRLTGRLISVAAYIALKADWAAVGRQSARLVLAESAPITKRYYYWRSQSLKPYLSCD